MNFITRIGIKAYPTSQLSIQENVTEEC
jgi:hypothetical protein